MPHHKFAKIKASPWPYVILAFGWSWLMWIPLALSGLHVSTVTGAVFFMAGLLGPGFSAIVLTTFLGDEQERRDYWERVSDLPPEN